MSRRYQTGTVFLIALMLTGQNASWVHGKTKIDTSNLVIPHFPAGTKGDFVDSVEQREARKHTREEHGYVKTHLECGEYGLNLHSMCFCPRGCIGPLCKSVQTCSGAVCRVQRKSELLLFYHPLKCPTCRCEKTYPDEIGTVVCPANPIVPATKLLVVICCASGNQTSTSLRTDALDIHEDNWQEKIPYCRMTLNKRVNVGLEATAYLNFLRANYDKLPDFMIMVHGNHGWHDHVNKKYLLARNVKLPIDVDPDEEHYVPLPGPMLHDPDVDFRIMKQISMQTFYDHTLVKKYNFTAKRINGFGQDRLHFCCAQFVVSRGTILKKPKSFYAGLMDYVYSEFDDYRTSREMEHNWQTFFTGSFSIKGSTFALVNKWRDDGLNSGCDKWNCTCQGLSNLYNVDAELITTSKVVPNYAKNWWATGYYLPGVKLFQLFTMSGSDFGVYAHYSPEGRPKPDGACNTTPAKVW